MEQPYVLNCVIVDDEPLAIEGLHRQLKSIDAVYVSAVFHDTLQASMHLESGDDINTVDPVISMNLFPNPADQDFTLEMNFSSNADQTCAIRVVDIMGRVVEERVVPISQGILHEHIDLQNGIADGLYMVSVVVSGNCYTQRLIVSKD